MKIELKSIEHSAFASQETVCYTANLYVDGRKIGTVGNDGHGGCNYFYGDRAADEWCHANLPKWMGSRDAPIDTDIETYCGTLLDDWLAACELKKTSRGCVLFTDAVDGKLYQVRHRGALDRTVAALASAHPGATILNGLPFAEALTLYRKGTAP